MAQMIYLESVRLYRDVQLGGMVCKAKFCGLMCAAKLLLPLVPKSVSNQSLHKSVHDDSSSIHKFEQEYSLLGALKHPHLVQYLGLYKDSDAGIVFLVMELMNKNLTRFLECSQQQLPYHTQVNLCHDVALAIAYLHSNGLVHCDLSSNNVLVTAGSRAKVSDFGMRRLADAIPTCKVLTHNSAKPAYLPPEALQTPAHFCKGTDCFSIGVLAIQIVTRQLPSPGPAVLIVKDPGYPRRVQAIVPEMERRKADIESIDSSHPLKSLACSCLSYEAKLRPSANSLCQSLNSLKESAQYIQSLRKQREHLTSSRSPTLRSQTYQQQLEKLQQDNKSRQDQVVAQQCQIEVLQLQLATKNEELRKVRMQLEVKSQEHRQEEQTQQSSASGGGSPSGLAPHGLVSRGLAPRGLVPRGLVPHVWSIPQASTRQKSDEVLSTALPKKARQLQVVWQLCNSPPTDSMYRGACATDGVTVYCNSAGSSKVFAYALALKSWSTLPDCSLTDFGLVVIEGSLTTVGGCLDRSPLNSLMSFSNRRKIWQECFPPMPTKRFHPSVVYKDKVLVVAGGQAYQLSSFSTVELLKTDTQHWHTASSLPYAVTHMSAAICGENIYLVGGSDSIGRSTLSAYTCLLPELVASCTSTREQLISGTVVWRSISDSPLHLTTCANLGSRLVAVGGRNLKKRPNHFVYIYDKEDNSWSEIGHVSLSRYECLLVGLPGDRLMLVGGQSKSSYLCDAFLGSSV